MEPPSLHLISGPRADVIFTSSSPLTTLREQRRIHGDGGGVPPAHQHLPRHLHPFLLLRLVPEEGVEPLAAVVVEPAHQHEAVLVADAVGAVQPEGQVIS